METIITPKILVLCIFLSNTNVVKFFYYHILSLITSKFNDGVDFDVEIFSRTDGFRSTR